MTYFIASDSEVRRTRIFWLPIGPKKPFVTRIAVSSENGTLLIPVVSRNFGVEDLLPHLPDHAEYELWYRDKDSNFYPTFSHLHVDGYGDIAQVPDVYFATNIMDFTEHIPQNTLPYTMRDKKYLFTRHKLYERINESDPCDIRAQKMLHNHQLLLKIVNESRTEKEI